MKTIYFIDNESIKRTAKAIQKTNPTFKHTVILDDLAKLLGYTSYNEYEHYLTNVILSKNSGLHNLKALTKIDSMELLGLKDKFLSQLRERNYSVDALYFINKIIDNQKQGFLEHSYLDLKSYIYYLPFIFKETDTITTTDSGLIRHGKLQDIIKIVIDEYNRMDLESIHFIIRQLKSSPDYSADVDLYSQFTHLNDNLKTRGIYYYIKSILEDFEYDEGILTKLIFNGDSIEKIEHELNFILSKKDNVAIPVFFKEDKQLFLDNYFPFIRSVINESNPFVFGKHVNQKPFFADMSYLRSNISLIGVPGCGKGAFLYTFIFQLLMNNRGVCILNTIGETYMDRYIDHMATSLNKKNDIFVFNQDSNIRSISSAVHNDKILLTSCARRMDARRGIDIQQTGMERFENILSGLTEHFFTNKFKTKKVPFYIIIEDSHTLSNISLKARLMIEKLNALNIFLVFDNQVHEDSIASVCDVQLISNSSFRFFSKSRNFEFSKLMEVLENTKTIIGKEGPSRLLPPVFSVIYKGSYIDQFIIEVDDGLFNNLPNP